MPNYFAYFMLIAWPFFASQIFKRCTLEQSVILFFLASYLLLPAKVLIDLPLIPALDKANIPALTAFFILYRNKLKVRLMPDDIIIRRTVILLFLFPIFTLLANTDTLRYGYRVFNGLGAIDLIGMSFNNFAYYLLPFVIACQFLRTDESHKLLVKMIALAGIFYSLPVLWEIRMSPQLHSDIYGFFPHSFRQQARQGGFRAIVFLGHGLLVAIFLAMSILCIGTLWKTKVKLFNFNSFLFIGFMFLVLIFSKSLGALVYVLMLLPIIFFFKPKTQITIASMLLIVVVSFPALRTYDIIPIDPMLEFFEGIDPDRAGSLKFRFDNEDILLEKANLRSLFGWGTWGRNRVFDPYSGQDISVTDGVWVILFGIYGWTGYATIFLLACAPVLMIRKFAGGRSSKVSPYTAALCLVLAMNMIDLLPNSSISSLTFLIAGAILGRVIHIRNEIKSGATHTKASGAPDNALA